MISLEHAHRLAALGADVAGNEHEAQQQHSRDAKHALLLFDRLHPPRRAYKAIKGWGFGNIT